MRNTNVLSVRPAQPLGSYSLGAKRSSLYPDTNLSRFSPTFLKLDSCSEIAPKNSCLGAPLAAAHRTGCIDIPRYRHSIVQSSLETSGMAGSWKASRVAGERGEEDDNETMEREGVCELS